MSWIDITLTLKGNLPPWPGERPFLRDIKDEIGKNGAICNLSMLSMSSHAGTHMDAPKHFLADGADITALSPDTLMGPAYLIDLSGLKRHAEAADFEGRLPQGVTRLLVKTRNSGYIRDGVFHTDFLGLTEPAAAYLARIGVRFLGWDYYSFAPYDSPAGAHRAFLSAPGATALENADLTNASEGWYDLVCLPLKVEGAEGAPARAFIRKREG